MDTNLAILSFQENKIQDTVSDMVEFATSLVVDNDTSYKRATRLYRQAKEWRKYIDGYRKEMTEPLRKQTSAINDKAKELTDPLDAVIDMANAKANSYVKMLEISKAKRDEELRQAASLFDSDGVVDLYIPEMERVVRGDGAITVTKTSKSFKVVDISKVPTKYLIVDEAAVKLDLKMGICEIPGLEIFEEKTTQLRIR